MNKLIKCMMIVSALAAAGVATTGPARADEPGTVTIHPQVIVGNPRRPVVTIEISRQRPDIPLHALTHPLDKSATRPSAAPLP
jgi:hypothetical protein